MTPTRYQQSLVPGTDAPPRKEPPCDGSRSDGSPCRQRGIHQHNDKLLCGAHYKSIADANEQRPVDLAKYEMYQVKAFGAVVFTMSDVDLHTRKLELAVITGDHNDLRFVRLRAERDAIKREIERRNKQ